MTTDSEVGEDLLLKTTTENESETATIDITTAEETTDDMKQLYNNYDSTVSNDFGTIESFVEATEASLRAQQTTEDHETTLLYDIPDRTMETAMQSFQSGLEEPIDTRHEVPHS